MNLGDKITNKSSDSSNDERTPESNQKNFSNFSKSDKMRMFCNDSHAHFKR